jgi:hypothetical protein
MSKLFILILKKIIKKKLNDKNKKNLKKGFLINLASSIKPNKKLVSKNKVVTKKNILFKLNIP